LETLAEIAQETPWLYQRTPIQPSPYIPVPATLDEYIDSLDAKQAHELRRKMRRAARSAIPVTMEIIANRELLGQALEDFFRLMVQEADKAAFLTPVMRTQMEAIAEAAFDNGWLQLVFLKVGHDRAAAYLNFDYDGRIWAYNSGFDTRFAELSPGWLLMAEMMQWCIANKIEAFDFMRGEEEYKYRFGGVDRFVWRATLMKEKDQTKSEKAV
jgi:CelD/BcsL family acetyltransferase involved in cellulose biosynthesis